MRDILSDLETDAAANPVERARALSRRTLAKRFYEAVEVGTQDGPEGSVHAVLLDGRAVKTPTKEPLRIANRGVAEAMAGEWAAQGKEIDPLTMPVTRIVNVAVDAVAKAVGEVADDIAAYAGNDLLCYRAEGPDRLCRLQEDLWGPVIARAEARHGGRFKLAAGIMPVRQDPELVARVRAALEGRTPLHLAALHVATTITGSALLALSLGEGEMEADAVWQAACVDEDWNIEQWGMDHEAAAVRAARRRDFDAAALILSLQPV